MKRDVSQSRVRELFDYDAQTGEFTRIVGRNGRYGGIGPVRKSFDRYGYQLIGIDSSRVFAHRLAWIYVNGDIGDLYVDHINGDRKDNRISNLRLVTKTENNQAISAYSKKSGTGFSGVYSTGRKFRIFARINGENYRIGGFETPSLAHQELVRLKRELCTVGPRV